MSSKSRAGFTLIEMLVSMALTLLVMTILSQAFVMALSTFSALKGLGDMQQNLRTAIVIFKSDLSSNHFEGDRRVSNLDIATNLPQAGFFVVKHGSAFNGANSLYKQEGTDASNIPSNWAVDHFLHMTVRRNGNRPENVFSTSITTAAGGLNAFFGQKSSYNLTSAQLAEVTWSTPFAGGGTGYYSSQWAEVVYYLVLNPVDQWAEPNDAGSAGSKAMGTYSLYRAQFVMVPDSTHVNGKVPNGDFAGFEGMACEKGKKDLTFFSPENAASSAAGLRTIDPTTLTTPFVSTAGTTLPPQWPAGLTPAVITSPSGARLKEASTLVLPNVISFEVQIMKQNQNINGTYHTDTSFAATNLASNGAPLEIVYDTTQFDPNGPNAANYQNRYSMKGIQVTLRVWDSGTRQTRQSTFVQDL